MGIPIVDGRGLEPADSGRSVILINETMARQFWPGRRAVGQRIICTPPESGFNIPGELEIVGVVRDAYMTGIDRDPAHRLPAADHTVRCPTRWPPTAPPPTRSWRPRRASIRRLRVRVQSLSDGLGPKVRRARVGAFIAGLLGAIALGFACVGMFGVFAYWVRQRTQEIGVRMALGAQSSDVIRLVIGTTARAVLIGLVGRPRRVRRGLDAAALVPVRPERRRPGDLRRRRPDSRRREPGRRVLARPPRDAHRSPRRASVRVGASGSGRQSDRQGGLGFWR